MVRLFYSENVLRLSLSLLLAVPLLLMGETATWAQNAAGQRPQPGELDISVSRVIMHVGKTGLGHDHAVIGSLKSGQILLGAPRNAGLLIFDMTSFDADGPDARKYVGLRGEIDANTRRQVNENMHNASVLNSARFPTATFQIESALPVPPSTDAKTATHNATYLLRGKFMLMGLARPLDLTCEVIPHGDQQRVRTTFVLKQTDYGIIPMSKALGTIGVANEIKVYGELVIAPHQR